MSLVVESVRYTFETVNSTACIHIVYQYQIAFFVNARLQEDPPAGVNGAPTDNNIMLWNAVIFG